MEGKFTNYKNEKLDDFYAAIGIPWVPRKLMTSTSPTIEISKADDQWTIKTSSMMSTSSVTFKLGEEYTESMPGGRSMKNVATVEEGKLIIASESDRGKSKRELEFTEEGFTMIMTHEKTDIVAKRFFKKA